MLLAMANMILGPTGIAVIVLGVAGSFIAASAGMTGPRSGIISLACGALAFICAAVVRTTFTGGFTL